MSPTPQAQALAALTRVAEPLWQAVAPWLPGFSVEVLPQIDSTNSELMRRARAGDTSPVLLVAAEQRAGRGRRGRDWIAAPGDCLTFSLGLPLQPLDWSGLSLAVGCSLAACLPPTVRLKWPNDLWWHDRKLGGILVEAATQADQQYAVVGVGLNLRTPALPTDSAPDAALAPMAAPVGLLELLSPGADQPDVGDVLLQCVPPLVRDLQRFAQEGFAAFQTRFAQRDALQGRPVRLSDGQSGTAVGVRHDGALLLQQGAQVQAVLQQEVSVRPC